jgi:hypothetical protein
VLTGYAVAPAGTNERPLTEDALAARMHAPQRLGMVASTASVYLADRGFAGRERHLYWARAYCVTVLAPPRSGHAHAWPRDQQRWHARLRHIVEVVHSTWTEQFRLNDEQPHISDGVLSRFAAMAALSTICVLLNRSLGRPNLAIAGLVQLVVRSSLLDHASSISSIPTTS